MVHDFKHKYFSNVLYFINIHLIVSSKKICKTFTSKIKPLKESAIKQLTIL